MGKITLIVCLFVVFSTLNISNSAALVVKNDTTNNVIYVDDDGGPDIDFTCIQDAINASSDGDTIFVYNGTYNENIVINKSFLTLQGEDNENTIIKANGETVSIVVDNVYVSQFKITNNLDLSDIGIHMINSDS